MEFDASTPRSTPVFVTRVKAKSPSEQQRFADLMRFIEAAGRRSTSRALASTTGETSRIRSNHRRFRLRPVSRPAQGLWTCIPHLVRKHPIFAGLPADGMMRDIYENVWATQTLRDLEVEPIVASIGFKWFSEDHKLHYSGPANPGGARTWQSYPRAKADWWSRNCESLRISAKILLRTRFSTISLSLPRVSERRHEIKVCGHREDLE